MSGLGDPMGYLGMKPTTPADIGIPAVPASAVQEGVGGPQMPRMAGLAAGTPSTPKRVAMPALKGGGLAAVAQALGASNAPAMSGAPVGRQAARSQRAAGAKFR